MDTNEEADVVTEETNDSVDISTEETAEKPQAKPKRTPQEELEYFQGRVKRIQKDLGLAVESAKEVPKPATSELDETQLDYLDLKGITDSDEIDIIQKVISKTGQTVRQALKDDYIISKLDILRKEKALKDATPGSTRRSSSPSNDVDYWIAKYDQTGELPDDFDLRSKVVNLKYEKENPNRPGWRK